MFRALGFGKGSVSEPSSRSASTVSLNLLDDAIALEHALRSMDLLMDDRIDEAQRILANGNSTFSKLARGVINFIEATLGFEPEAIKKASDSLWEAEEAATTERQRAIKSGVKTSSLFPPGLEYAVVHAEAQLLGAITLFLSESVIDSAKALLKLRRAYQTLDEVHKQMKTANYQSTRLDPSMLTSGSTPNLANDSSFSSDAKTRPKSAGNPNAVSSSASSSKSGSGSSTPSLNTKPSVASIRTNSSISSSSTTSKSKPKSKSKKPFSEDDDDGILTIASLQNPEISEKARMFQRARLQRHKRLNGSEKENEDFITQALAELEFTEHHGKRAGQEAVDEYIISAVNACYGILQLVISILPPGVGRVLSIVGFRGSKEEGLALLWHSVESLNIHGAIGLLALLQYYDGPTQFSDIQLPPKKGQTTVDINEPLPEGDELLAGPPPDADDQAATKRRLRVALRRASRHFSHGALWQLQEGRMEASRGRLREAIAIMDDTSRGPINMRQVEGLMLFDKTMFIVTIHGYERAAQNFIKLIDLNTWSHMFYTYLSAMCQVEIYRKYKKSDPAKAEKAKKLASEALDRAPSFLGKRKFMAKTMPFDVFALRKLNQWKATAKQNKCHIIDAVSTSPIHEIIYFWNGFGRMLPEDLEKTLTLLGYAAEPKTQFSFNSGTDKDIVEEIEDESLIRYLLQSVALRNLGRVEEGYDLLKTHVLPKIYVDAPNKGTYPSGLTKVHFSKAHRDPWVAPSAIYETAVYEWKIGGPENIQRARDYLDMAHSWADDFELSTRVGLKIKSAISRLENVDKP